jgi:hypothetical protein
MPGTKMIDFFIKLISQFFAKTSRIKRFTTNSAADKIQRDNFVPASFQKVLKLNSLFGADSPALPATCTKRHTMQKSPLFFLINIA